MKFSLFLTSFTLMVIPFLVQAQTYFGPIDNLFLRAAGFINTILVPLIFTLALLAFIWGMFQYFILNGDNDTERKKGKALMVSAVVGFVLMVSIWAIVNLVASGLTTGLNNSTPRLPGVPTL